MELIPIDNTPGLQLIGDEFVALKPMCEALGIDIEGQRRKLKERSWATTEKISVVAADGKTREMTALHKDAVPMWLATLSENKVKPEARPTLITYQNEAARALNEHFTRKKHPTPEQLTLKTLTQAQQLLQQITTTAQAWAIMQHIEPPATPAQRAQAGYNPDQGATLTITTFLKERHPGVQFRPRTHVRFGKALIETYRATHKTNPGNRGNHRHYTEADRPLMEATATALGL